jgi:hypothetical protein
VATCKKFAAFFLSITILSMLNKEEYLYVIKNKDYDDWTSRNDLPGSDDQVFVNGILEKAFLSEEELKHLNNIVKYEKGIYYKNQIILDEEGNGNVNSFNIVQPGYYELIIKGAGGKASTMSTNWLNDSTKVLQWERENTALQSYLKFYEDFTWVLIDEVNSSLSQEVNGHDTLDVFKFNQYTIRKGTFKMSESIVILDQTHYAEVTDENGKYVITVEKPVIDKEYRPHGYWESSNFDIFSNEKNVQSLSNIDKDGLWIEEYIEAWDYSVLFSDYLKDGDSSLFRKLNFVKAIGSMYKAMNTGATLELLNLYSNLDDDTIRRDKVYRNDNYYYVTKAMQFMEKEPRNSVYGINGADVEFKALQVINDFNGANRIESAKNTYAYIYGRDDLSEERKKSTIVPGWRTDKTNAKFLQWIDVDKEEIIPPNDKTGSWKIKSFPNGIPNTNVSPAGDGGYYRTFLKLDKGKLEYMVGKAYEADGANTGGQGSYVNLNGNQEVYVGGGGLFIKDANNLDDPNKIQKFYGGFSTYNDDTRYGSGLNGNKVTRKQYRYRGSVTLGGGDSSDFESSTGDKQEIDQSIGMNLGRDPKQNTLEGLHGKSYSTKNGEEAHRNIGLGGSGSGIFKNTEWLCNYNKAQNGSIFLRFLGPTSSTLYDVKYNDNTNLSHTGRIFGNDGSWAQCDLMSNTKVPAGTPIKIQFFHNDSSKEVGVKLRLWQDGETPGNWIDYSDTFTEAFLDRKYISFMKDRVSNNIETLEFTTINKHIEFQFSIIDRQYKIRVNDSSKEINSWEIVAKAPDGKDIAHDVVLREGVPANSLVTLVANYSNKDKGMNRADNIYLSSLYEGQQLVDYKVEFKYDQTKQRDQLVFTMPSHDCRLDLTPTDVYKLNLKPMNTINKAATENLPPLIDGKIVNISVGFDPDNMQAYGSTVDIELSSNQQIFVKVEFNTERIRLDEELISFPPNTIVEKAGNTLANVGENVDTTKEQWFSFIMPEYSVTTALYVELRTYVLTILKDRHNILQIRSTTGEMEFEVGDKIKLEFDIERKYKLTRDSGIIIYGNTYQLDNSDLSKKQFTASITGGRTQLFRDYKDGNTESGYYTDFCEMSKSELQAVETVYFDLTMQNNDISIYFSPTFLLNSVITQCGENEMSSTKIITCGYYRIIAAGCRSGNGGNGSNGGAPNSSAGEVEDDEVETVFSGRPGGKGGSGYKGGNGGTGSDAAPWKLDFGWWKGFIRIDPSFIKGSGGGGGQGGDGFIGGQGASGGVAGWYWAVAGDTGNNGNSFLGEVGKNYDRELIRFRGGVTDYIIFLEESIINAIVGSSGSDGGDGPPAEVTASGCGGGGGGSGGEVLVEQLGTDDVKKCFAVIENPNCATINNIMSNGTVAVTPNNGNNFIEKTRNTASEYVLMKSKGTFKINETFKNIKNQFFPLKIYGGTVGEYKSASYEFHPNLGKGNGPYGVYEGYSYKGFNKAAWPRVTPIISSDSKNYWSNTNDGIYTTIIPNKPVTSKDIVESSINATRFQDSKESKKRIINSGGGGYPLNIGPLDSQNWQSDMEYYNNNSGGGNCSKALDRGRIPFSGRSGNHVQKLGIIGDNSGLTIYTCLGDLGNRGNIKGLDDKNTRLNYAYKVGMYIGSDFCPSDKGGLKIIFIGDYSDRIVNTTTSIQKLDYTFLEDITENNGQDFIDWWSVDNLPLN